MQTDKSKRRNHFIGAERELKLALSRLRAAETHLRYARSVNTLPPGIEAKVRAAGREVFELTGYVYRHGLKPVLSAGRAIDNSDQPTMGKVP